MVYSCRAPKLDLAANTATRPKSKLNPAGRKGHLAGIEKALGRNESHRQAA
jgi:hypothetical protein